MTYTEDALIEQPAINLFNEIGWQTLDCFSETYGEDTLLGWDNRSEIVIVRELREALTQIKDYQK
jgi:type I restriction enzyme R subunit